MPQTIVLVILVLVVLLLMLRHMVRMDMGGSTSGKARGDRMASSAPTKLEVDKSAAATTAMVFFPSLLLPARQLEEGGDHIH